MSNDHGQNDSQDSVANFDHGSTTASRRTFLKTAAAAGVGGAAAYGLSRLSGSQREPVVILKVADYAARLKDDFLRGFRELNLTADYVGGRSVLIKPNLVEPHAGAAHINVHPLVIGAVIDSFRSLGAKSVIVGEGAGHVHDSYHVLHASGLIDVLADSKTQFVDLNFADIRPVANVNKATKLERLLLPTPVLDADIFVSLAKMKTHHWAGATLTMKNLFGIMPGSYYGWPKNVLHQNGISESIVDINAALLSAREGKPHISIVDGIVGMEGDGPIMGTPKEAGVLVIGANPVATDATCCRIMGIDPTRVDHISHAALNLGPIHASRQTQRGESIREVQTDFELLEFIPAHRKILGV